MPSRFTLRMQFGPHQNPDDVEQQLMKLIKEAPIDEVLMFFYGEEQNDGHITLEEAQLWLETSRKYRQSLRAAGVVVSCNPWETTLHTDRGRKLKRGQDWQTMMDPNGRTANAVICPLDPNWQAYYAQLLTLYANEDFRVIWVEDDIRLRNHADLDWGGCFCPLHIEEFNKRTGINATREQIVANCTAPGEPHPWRQLWLDMWDDTLTELIESWRKIVEPRGIQLGLMSSGMDSHAAEGRKWANWWKALAGDGLAIHRPHFWSYGNMDGSAIYHCALHLEQNRMIQPQNIECGPEIECFNYGAWNKSFRQIAAQIATAHILGANNLNISLYDFMGNRIDDEPERARFLKNYRPVCDWLADMFPMNLKTEGVGLPWSEDAGRKIHTNGSGKWQSLMCPMKSWATNLGSIGYAMMTRQSDTVNALAGAEVWMFDDEQIEKMLSAGLLIDNEAARLLLERGFGNDIGIKSARYITQDDVLYSIEECLTEEFGLRKGAQISINLGGYTSKLLQAEFAEGVRIVSDIRDPHQRVVGHGLAVFNNSRGGRIAIAPWSAEHWTQMKAQRAAQLHKTITYLDPTGVCGFAEGCPWLFTQFLTNGEIWRGVVWNQSYDEITEISVHLPKQMPPPAKAMQIEPSGLMTPAQFKHGVISLSRPMHQWEFVVMYD